MSIEVQSDLFAGDSHALPFQQPGSSSARRMTRHSGRKCFESFGRYSPIGSLAKMFLESSTWNSTTCYLTWEIRSTSRHLIFRLSPSMPDTDDIGCGSSVEPSIWPTPTAQDNNQVRQTNGAKGHKDRSTTLGGAIRLWPTPMAHEWRLGYQDRNNGKKGTQESLTTKVINDLGGRDQVSGQLNPEFCEWLMGYPIGWTDLKPSATR